MMSPTIMGLDRNYLLSLFSTISPLRGNVTVTFRLRKKEMSAATTELPTKEANLLKGHEGAVLAARFNGDGNYALTCGKDRTIRLWNPHRGILIKTYKSHGREVRDVHVTS